MEYLNSFPGGITAHLSCLECRSIYRRQFFQLWDIKCWSFFHFSFSFINFLLNLKKSGSVFSICALNSLCKDWGFALEMFFDVLSASTVPSGDLLQQSWLLIYHQNNHAFCLSVIKVKGLLTRKLLNKPIIYWMTNAIELLLFFL